VISTEYVSSTLPFTVRRRAKWGDCDPAGVVYTVTFSEYVISAAELFYETLFSTNSQRVKGEQGFGTPTRALSFDFRASLRPEDEFDMTVTVDDVRSSTYVLDITGRRPGGEIVFIAKLTPVCVQRPERRSIEIPQPLREALLLYAKRCAALGAQGAVPAPGTRS
jgi:acyl-CoA thioesterase FadM